MVRAVECLLQHRSYIQSSEVCQLTYHPCPKTCLLARLTLIRAHHLHVRQVWPHGVSTGATVHLNTTHDKVSETMIGTESWLSRQQPDMYTVGGESDDTWTVMSPAKN